jgi:hypothetical protein
MKSWSSSQRPQKQLARQATIIEPYRSLFGHSIPQDRQYWTLCGQCVQNGEWQTGCEPDQILESGLISSPTQFHGVEKNESWHQENIGVKNKFHFYHNDFYQQMVEAHLAGNFRPAIINADFFRTPITEANNYAEILQFLTEHDYNSVMVVGNFALRTSHRAAFSPEIIMEELNKQGPFRLAMKNGNWNFDQTCFEYCSSKLKMGTVIFYRKI